MYQIAPLNLWKGKIDADDLSRNRYWHQVMSFLDLTRDSLVLPAPQNAFALIGYASNEGVRRSKGRVGTTKGPNAIRKTLSELPFYADGRQLYDAGTIIGEERALEKNQIQLKEKVQHLLHTDFFPIVLGGGQELTWSNYLALTSEYPNERIGIINFDAHFDMRPPIKGANSETTFYTILNYCNQQNKPFDYLCLGIQSYDNAHLFFEQALETGVEFILADTIMTAPITDSIQKIRTFINRCDKVCVTIDLDVFDAAFAPGVSRPCVGGLNLNVVVTLLEAIVMTNKLAVYDIAELNPIYDVDGRTAKLAAVLVFQLIQSMVKANRNI